MEMEEDTSLQGFMFWQMCIGALMLSEVLLEVFEY